MELTPDFVTRTIARRSFCTLATSSAARHPHVAGILYEAVGTDLWFSTDRSSRKGRNLAANPKVGICIPVRRLPVGPPSSIQFQGRAQLVGPDDPGLRSLIGAGHLGSISGHGELERPDGCFVRVTPVGPVHTYGLGMSLVRLLRNPLDAAGRVDLTAAA
jgi:hypothetical protein